MTDAIDFTTLQLPIPEIVYTYSKEKQQTIFNYLQQMDEHNKKGYVIASNHLGTSFNICKSNGYKEWTNKK